MQTSFNKKYSKFFQINYSKLFTDYIYIYSSRHTFTYTLQNPQDKVMWNSLLRVLQNKTNKQKKNKQLVFCKVYVNVRPQLYVSSIGPAY